MPEVILLHGLPRDEESIARAADRFRVIVARADATVAAEDRRLGIVSRRHDAVETARRARKAERMRQWARHRVRYREIA